MSGYAHPEYLVETEWLAEHVRDPSLRILDCTTTIVADPEGGSDIIRPERAVFEEGHIPGAQFVDMQNDLSDAKATLNFTLPNAAAFAVSMERFGISNGCRVVTYSTGNPWWATRAWWLLRVFGFENAAVLNGGMAKWKREGRPLEAGLGKSPRDGKFPTRQPRRLTVNKYEVIAAIGNDAICTINALPRAQHSGEGKAYYGRAGHISGSRNIPGATFIDPATNTFVSADAINAAFAAAGAADKPVISYCGGGVTATMLAFVLALIGRDDVKVYDGSMQEWAADAALPMEKG